MVAHHHPEWEIWRQFLHGTTSSALSRDALLENYAIEIPGGEHLVINSSTAPIIYDKGGSILRQVEGFIGAGNFRQGLQRYLKTHAYDCADSQHLWEAFEAESRQPVTALMKSWIEQPGFPLVTAAREGATLVLSQERFTYLPNDSDQRWVVPVNLRTFTASGDSQCRTILIDEAVKRVEIGSAATAYKLNDGQTGFYRVHYADRDNLKALGSMVRQKTLAAEDRWGLENDLYARMISAGLPFDEYLQFLAHYQSEEDFLPLASIAAHLAHAHGVAAPGRRAAVTALAMPWYEALLERIGYAPRPSEPQTTAILRDHLLFDAVRYGSAQAEGFALQQFETLTRGGPVHPDILRSVMQTGAWHGDGRAFDWFDQRLGRSESEHERMNILAAIGCFRDPAQIGKSLDYVLAKVPPRNQFIPLVAMSANPHAVPLLWDWYVAHIGELERFHPMLYERVIAAIVPTAGIDRADEVRGFFAEYLRKSDKVRDVVRLSLERLEIHLRMRRRCLT